MDDLPEVYTSAEDEVIVISSDDSDTPDDLAGNDDDGRGSIELIIITDIIYRAVFSTFMFVNISFTFF